MPTSSTKLLDHEHLTDFSALYVFTHFAVPTHLIQTNESAHQLLIKLSKSLWIRGAGAVKQAGPGRPSTTTQKYFILQSDVCRRDYEELQKSDRLTCFWLYTNTFFSFALFITRGQLSDFIKLLLTKWFCGTKRTTLDETQLKKQEFRETMKT